MTLTDANAKESFEIRNIGDSYEILIQGISVIKLNQKELNLVAQVFDICRTDKTKKP